MDLKNIYYYDVHGARDVSEQEEHRIIVKNNTYITLTQRNRLGSAIILLKFINVIKTNDDIQQYLNNYIEDDSNRLHNKILIEYTFIKLILDDIIDKLDISFINKDNIMTNTIFNISSIDKFNSEEDKINIINIFNSTLKEVFITRLLRHNFLLFEWIIHIKDFYYIINYILTKIDIFNTIITIDMIKLYDSDKDIFSQLYEKIIIAFSNRMLLKELFKEYLKINDDNVFNLIKQNINFNIRIYKEGMSMPKMLLQPYDYSYDESSHTHFSRKQQGLYSLDKKNTDLEYYTHKGDYKEFINCDDIGSIYDKHYPDCLFPTKEEFMELGKCTNNIFNIHHDNDYLIKNIPLRNKIIIIGACAGYTDSQDNMEERELLLRQVSDAPQGYMKYLKYKKKYLELKKKHVADK